MKSWGKELSLQKLTHKTVMLLALLTAQRGQFIHMLKVQDVSFPSVYDSKWAPYGVQNFEFGMQRILAQ